VGEQDKDVIVCRCQEVTAEEIRKATLEGATTISDVKRVTRAGMGLCQGKTCSKMVARLISEHTGAPIDSVLPATFRPPVRPVKLEVLGGEEDCCPKPQK
jgi:bacterioferritin-associated ferredoxin